MELTNREVKAADLAHVPSGTFTAKAACLGLARLAHNLAPWTLRAPGTPWAKATVPTFPTARPRCPPAWPTAADPSACAPTNRNWPDAYQRAPWPPSAVSPCPPHPRRPRLVPVRHDSIASSAQTPLGRCNLAKPG